MQGTTTPKISRKALAILAVLLLGGIGAFAILRSLSTYGIPEAAPIVIPKIKTVTVLGYLEPQGKVVKLSATSSSGGNSRVAKLMVKQGDLVKKGQLIAVLDSVNRLEASLLEAEEQVRVTQANLEVVRAGAKTGEIDSQQAAIDRITAQKQGDNQAQIAVVARLRDEVQIAQDESRRYEMLYTEGATNASLRDSKRLSFLAAQKNLQEAQAVLSRIQMTKTPELAEARATLSRIAEVREVDVLASQAQVDRAIAAVAQAKAQLDLAYVRSPQDGVVLEINTLAGELLSTEGIVEIGQTDRMRAVLEVFESNIVKVQKGQKVRLLADSLPIVLTGEVVEIGMKVKRQNVVNSDTSKNIDARVIEVRVQLDSESVQQVKGLTNLQVTGEIQL